MTVPEQEVQFERLAHRSVGVNGIDLHYAYGATDR